MDLNRERTKESYFEKLGVQAKGTQKNVRLAIEKFETFVESKFERSLNGIITELAAMENTKRDSALFDLLQDHANFMNLSSIAPTTIRSHFSVLKNYLTYRGLKIHQEEIRQNQIFSKT